MLMDSVKVKFQRSLVEAEWMLRQFSSVFG